MMGLEPREDDKLAQSFNRLDANKNGEVSRNKAMVEISNILAEQNKKGTK